MQDDAPADLDILRVLGGPAAGKTYPLADEEVVLGRGQKAGIAIADSLLSRGHLKLIRRAGQWRIEDLGSTNGTWIRGERLVGAAPLPFRVPVRAGKTIFELTRPQTEEPSSSLDEAAITYRLQMGHTANAPLTATDEQASATASAEDPRLATIYRLQSLLNSEMVGKELSHAILEVITDVIPADHAYLLLHDLERDKLSTVCQRETNGRVESVDETFLSRSILNHVRQKAEAILSLDTRRDARFGGESLADMTPHSVMGVPMMGRNGLQGIIYLVKMGVTREYQREDLRFLAAIAYSAGMSIENRRLLDRSLRQERMAAIGMAAASLSHCVKNILTGLEGSVSLMRMGLDSNDHSLINAAWEILAKNHRRLSALMLDLLNLAKEELLELEMHNLTEIMLEAIEMMRVQAEGDKVRLVPEGLRHEASIHAEVDNRAIHRVLLNLLHNALDAVRERHGNAGTGWVKLRADLDEQKQTITITVQDNGVGIAPERLEKIFEVFQTTKGERGTGLGLAVTRKIVENHRGAITLESEIGKGTTFTIRLPVRQRRATATTTTTRSLRTELSKRGTSE